MMKRSESHLRRLEHISEKTSPTMVHQHLEERDSRPLSSSSSSSRSSSDRRNSSAFVDAETQTIVEEELTEERCVIRSGSRRSKGDGLESPALIRHKRNQQTGEQSSDSEPEAIKEIEEETYRWERKRGRASGSSQHLSLCESSSQSLNEPQQQLFGIGRRYTVDMSQYKYNDAWTKRVQPSVLDEPHHRSSAHPEKGIKHLNYKFFVRLFNQILLSNNSKYITGSNECSDTFTTFKLGNVFRTGRI
jgi:hypothetical protein